MGATSIKGTRVKDGSIQRVDLNTSTSGQAVITKVIAGPGVALSSTGVDPGTGDVTLTANLSFVDHGYTSGNTLVEYPKNHYYMVDGNVTFSCVMGDVGYEHKEFCMMIESVNALNLINWGTAFADTTQYKLPTKTVQGAMLLKFHSHGSEIYLVEATVRSSLDNKGTLSWGGIDTTGGEASTTKLGLVKVDGTTITITDGVISSIGGSTEAPPYKLDYSATGVLAVDQGGFNNPYDHPAPAPGYSLTANGSYFYHDATAWSRWSFYGNPASSPYIIGTNNETRLSCENTTDNLPEISCFPPHTFVVLPCVGSGDTAQEALAQSLNFGGTIEITAPHNGYVVVLAGKMDITESYEIAGEYPSLPTFYRKANGGGAIKLQPNERRSFKARPTTTSDVTEDTRNSITWNSVLTKESIETVLTGVITTHSHGSSSRNIDGGSPSSVYLASQVINGGTP